MTPYLTPGLYRRQQPLRRSDIGLVRMDIAGFVGFAARGPLAGLDKVDVNTVEAAVKLNSWPEFRTTFGGPIRYGYLPYAVQGFFGNGGKTCYVVRIAATDHDEPPERPRAASLLLPSAAARRNIARLSAPARRGEAKLALDTTRGLGSGDLILVSGNGVQLLLEVEEFLSRNEVRIASQLPSALPAGAEVGIVPPALAVTASSAGNWGNRIRLALTSLAASASVTDFALRVTLTPGEDPSETTQEEFYRSLSLRPDHPSFAPAIVNSASRLIRLTVPPSAEQSLSASALVPPAGQIGGGSGPGAARRLALSGGQDGLSGVGLRDFTGSPTHLRGLRLLEEIDEIGVLSAPDAVLSPADAPPSPRPAPGDRCAPPKPPSDPDPVIGDATAKPPSAGDDRINRIHQAMLEQCERLRYRVAIIDPPDRLTVRAAVGWRSSLTSRFGASYYPWLKVSDPLGVEGKTRRVPPSGHVAGIYARIDQLYGVQRPPANAALEMVVDLVDEISAQQQEVLNPAGVNALRAFAGRGIRVWGARSLAGKNEGNWTFIHVRRLMSMIEKSVEVSTQWAVFEPNDENLRRTLEHSLSVFLEAIWRNGGLQGNSPEQGFFVKCDETNNPPAVIDAGQLICKVGVATVAPMEFLVFELNQTRDGAAILEGSDV
jgi:hypothetical protein